jgi:hypothetical protein
MQYEGKWISVTSEYLESFVKEESGQDEKQPEFTQNDAAELAKALSKPTQDYLFSSDPEKAVLVQKSFEGTEEVDGITANHYIVGPNKENLKKYCQATIEAVYATEAYKKLSQTKPERIDEEKQKAIKECNEGIDADIKEEDTFDMWINKGNKLIYKIRFTDKKESGTYVEIGQTYKKGDVLPMFIAAHSDKDKYDGRFTLEYNSKSNVTKGEFKLELKGDSPDDTYNAKANFEFKPFDGDVTIEAPKDAIPIEQVLPAIGLDPNAQQSSQPVFEEPLVIEQ